MRWVMSFLFAMMMNIPFKMVAKAMPNSSGKSLPECCPEKLAKAKLPKKIKLMMASEKKFETCASTSRRISFCLMVSHRNHGMIIVLKTSVSSAIKEKLIQFRCVLLKMVIKKRMKPCAAKMRIRELSIFVTEANSKVMPKIKTRICIILPSSNAFCDQSGKRQDRD